ncbi:MAG: hypothetical protein ACAH80_00450 [Alphaproteobacteria bacterium]
MGYLGNQFKKATLSLALASTLATGFVATEANAQTVPVGGGQVYSQQVDQGGQQHRKPWENDPTYQRQIEAQQRIIDANIAKSHANLRAALAGAQQRYSLEVQREANWAAALRKNPNTKWSDWSALAAHQNSALANYNAQQVTHKANADAYIAQQQAYMETYTVRLDQQYERLPQYKQVAPAPVRAPTTTQPAAQPAKPNLPAANQSLTAEQQHDRLVRAYQDAQLRAAQSGGKIAMPKPADFGLDAKDPAIAPPGSNR